MKEYRIKVNGTSYNVIVEESSNGINVEAAVSAPAPQTVKNTPPSPPVSAPTPKKEAAPATSDNGFTVKSPLPGIILEISVNVGDHVTVGQKLMVIEAMKMENNLISEKEGIVKQIKAGKGDSVVEGDIIMIIE